MPLWEAPSQPPHTGKSGYVKTSPTGTAPFNIPGYAEELAGRTYPYYRQYIPKKYKGYTDFYYDFKYNPEIAKQKLKFWYMYLQANEKISQIPKRKTFQSYTSQVYNTPTRKYWKRCRCKHNNLFRPCKCRGIFNNRYRRNNSYYSPFKQGTRKYRRVKDFQSRRRPYSKRKYYW